MGATGRPVSAAKVSLKPPDLWPVEINEVAERAVEVVFDARAPVHEIVLHLAELGRDGGLRVDDRDETVEAVGRAIEAVLVRGIDAGHLVLLRRAAAVGSLRESGLDVVPGTEPGDAVVVEREVLLVGYRAVVICVGVEDRAVAGGELGTLGAEAHAAAAGEVPSAEGEARSARSRRRGTSLRR